MDNSLKYPNCSGVLEDSEQVFFHCTRFKRGTLGGTLIAENKAPGLRAQQVDLGAKMRKAENVMKVRLRT